ncbi:MAG: sulfatase-like hydrolase/transferase [Pseudomonadota bacterium]
MAQPPNLVFFMSDSHNRDALGCYGHPVAHTPNLDRLAARGARFTTPYCASPLCCPSRASIATGRFPHQTGYWDNVLAYDGRYPSWMKRLRDHGTDVVSVGKLHYRSEEDDAGFSSEIVPMHILNGLGGLVGLLRWNDEEPRRTGHFELYIDESGPGASSYIDYDRSITAHTIEWLRERAAATDRPFALFVSYACPHPPFQVEQRFFDLYDPAAIPLPTQWRSEDRPRHPAVDTLREKMGFETIDDEATLRRVLHAYYAIISHLDEQIGKVLEELEQLGLTEHTRILYTSDHGEAIGQHGLVGKGNLYETSMAVPLIMAGPGIPEGPEVTQPVSHVDLFPTILESFGVEPATEDSELPGQSMWPALESKRWPRQIFGEYHATASRFAGYMLRDGTEKLIYHAGYPPQLFDLAADPDENDDLAESEPKRVARLEAALRTILDPDAIDARAKADQQAMVERVGGNDAIRKRGAFPFTPPPGTDPRMVEVR